MTPATGLFPHDPPRRHVSASGTHPIQQTVPMRPPQRGITVHPGLTRRWQPANTPCRLCYVKYIIARPTDDLTAYDLYLRAYAMVMSSSRESLRRFILRSRRSRAIPVTDRHS